MSSKTKELYEVTFWAKKRVKAFTHNEARAMVEGMKNISLEKGIDSKVTTNTKFEVFQQGFFMNISSIATFMVGIFYAWTIMLILKAVQELNEEFRLIGTLTFIILIIITIRFPNTVGRWYDFNRN